MKDTLLDTLIRNSFCVMGFVICFFFTWISCSPLPILMKNIADKEEIIPFFLH
ncbi:unnamed protein product [Brassica rapa subsp. narinosa]